MSGVPATAEVSGPAITCTITTKAKPIAAASQVA